MHLYELSAIYAQVQTQLEEGEPEAADQALAKIDAIEGAFNEKAVQVAFVIKNMQSMADAVGKECEAMTARKKTIDGKIAGIKEYLRSNMERAAITKIECPQFKISLRDNPPRVNVIDAGAVPEEYVRQPETPPTEIDKKRIIEDWKVGVVIDGVEVIRGNRVEIK